MSNVFIPASDSSQASNAEMMTVIDTTTGDQWSIPARAVEAILSATPRPEALTAERVCADCGRVIGPLDWPRRRLAAADAPLDCTAHIHVAGPPDDLDRCAACGHDLRSLCHQRDTGWERATLDAAPMTDQPGDPMTTPRPETLTAEDIANLRTFVGPSHADDPSGPIAWVPWATWQRLLATLDAARTPAPDLRARIHQHRDGCNGRPHRRWYRGENKCDTLAALGSATPEPTLDAAWKAAEDALPEGWRMRVTRRDDEFDIWQASAVSPAFFDGENDNDAECVIGEAVVPAWALNALTAALARLSAPTDGGGDEPTIDFMGSVWQERTSR